MPGARPAHGRRLRRRAVAAATVAATIVALAVAPVAALWTGSGLRDSFEPNSNYASHAHDFGNVPSLAYLNTGDVTCADFIHGRVRWLSRWPFGMGALKEAYAGEFKGQLVVIKVPRRNAFAQGGLDGDFHYHHRVGPDEFSHSVVHESKHFLEIFQTTNHSHSRDAWQPLFAPYYGGCIGDEWGPLRAVAQQGPVMNLDKMVLAFRLRLGWAVRLRMVLQSFRLLQELARSSRLYTDLTEHQFGVDDQFNVRVYDLGCARLDEGAPPLQSDKACLDDVDCAPDFHVPAALKWLGYDQRCDRKRHHCAGFGYKSTAALMCHITLRPLMLVQKYNVPDAQFVRRINDIDRHCTDPDPARRWDHNDIYDALMSVWTHYNSTEPFWEQQQYVRPVFMRYLLSMVRSAQLMFKREHDIDNAESKGLGAVNSDEDDDDDGRGDVDGDATAYWLRMAREYLRTRPDLAASVGASDLY